MEWYQNISWTIGSTVEESGSRLAADKRNPPTPMVILEKRMP